MSLSAQLQLLQCESALKHGFHVKLVFVPKLWINLLCLLLCSLVFFKKFNLHALEIMEGKFTEIHFVHLPSQSNIYGLSWFRTVEPNVSTKLMIAALKKPIICFEFNNKPFEHLVPSSKEIHFTYIPGGAEIISIHSFNKSLDRNDFTIGITFSKEREEEAHNTAGAYYLNIYTEWEPSTELSLETISQSCLSLELKFIPYKLYHSPIFTNGLRETVWLLSGSDETIHLFKEDKGHLCVEHPRVEEYFPELTNLPSIVLSLEILHLANSIKRLTALGCEDGYLRVALVDTKDTKIEKNFSIKHDSPISCLKFFKWKDDIKRPSFLENENNEINILEEISDIDNYHLLVISALEPAIVYWNIFTEGFNDPRVISGSEQFDCLQCATVADLDMDGTNEIVLGTYGQHLLIYKGFEMYDLSAPSIGIKNLSSNGYSPPCIPKVQFTLFWQRKFAFPLLSVDYIDVTEDGLRELIVLSTKGLHILQHNLEETRKVVINRLKEIVNNSPTKKEQIET